MLQLKKKLFMQHLVATCALLVSAAAFNFDVEHADIFTEPSHHPNTGHQPDSYFGYTVNLLKEPGFSGEATLLAGAPRGNSTIPNHQRLIQPGVVYQCVIHERSRPCKLLVLDTSGNELVQSISGLRYMDNKNHAWIGGAMAVQNSGNGRIVVCGPRWKNQVHKDFYLMNGVCYWYLNKTYFGTNARKIIPLVKQAKQGYNVVQSYDRSRNITEVFYYAYGGAGISVEFVENSMEMLVGAPGVFDWIGSVIRYQDYTLPSSVNPQAGFFTKVLVPNPYKTPRLSPSSYFGYSVGSGKFFSSYKTLYVGGAPRDGVLKGKVYIFDYPSREEEPLDIKVELMGTQMGEYFGSSICVVDLNSDGLDDLVVGAPLHSLKNFGSLKQTGDEGRIYVFINEDNGIMTEIGDQTKIMGLSQQGARFGTAISKIGDLNHDGYPDIAVGAPYENEGRGAIYIFHGMKSGIKPKFVQRISALEIAESIRGFGISITKGIDLDSNHYKDIAVGAYLSGHAIILKSHPIITFHPKLETNVTNINFNATGFLTKYCLLYNGNYAPPSVDVTIKLKADVAHGRANFINKMGTNSNIISITRKIKHVVEFCEEFEVEILPLYQDFTQPIDISMEYKLPDSESPRVPSNHREKRNEDRQFCKFCPVVDPSHPSQVNRRISYVIGCGEDGKCRTDLKTEISLVDEELPFVIGTASSIELKVAISNSGDPAFLAKTKIILPAMLSLLRIPSFCQEEQSDLVTDAVLICDIGNPLPKNDSTDFFLELDTKNIPKKEEMFTFIANSSSVGMEISGEDNGHTLEIPLKLVADVSVLGKSSQSQFYLPKQNEIKSHKTFSFSHAFEVRNYGPSPVEQVKLTFKFPTMIENREGYVNFMKVYHPETSLNSQSFPCTAKGSEFYVDTAERNMTSLDIESSKSEPQSLQKQEKRRRKRDLSHEIIYTSASLPSNKTFFSNCTLPGEGCMVITCIAGPFTTPRSIASLIFPIKVLPYSFGSILEENDIILVSSIGSVSIIDPPYSVQPDIHRSDLAEAYTLFLGSITEPTVDSWIIALSIAGGILILLLVTLGLVKFGFFKRHKKEELEELKYHAEIEKSFREDFN